MSIASVASFFVGLKAFQPIWAIAGPWDVGWGEGGNDPGRNGRRPGEPTPRAPVWPELTHSAHGLVCTHRTVCKIGPLASRLKKK